LVIVVAAALWLTRQSLRGRCWHWLTVIAGLGMADEDDGHAKTKLLRTDYGRSCPYCWVLNESEKAEKSLYPLPVVRLWECRCGTLWRERGHENAKEYAERMADLMIAESEKPIVTPPPKAAP